MKSQADIIYNHIEKQKRDNVEKVEINKVPVIEGFIDLDEVERWCGLLDQRPAY